MMEGWRRSLPIYPARKRLLSKLKTCSSCVVVGETGSGKTTQIPQYLLESGVGGEGVIAVTQPRRVAAVTVAKRVADERGCRLGSEVGYAVRFDECHSPETRLKYMTDGMLLREAMSDPLLARYGTVILDEAHERTVHTDLLFGVVKAAQRRRQKRWRLKVIVMSATLAAEEFSQFFNEAEVLYIQGRQYPVQVLYTAEPQVDYLKAAVVSVLQLHCSKESGDILVFLTGREEIESMMGILKQCRAVFPSDWQDIQVQPLYAALPSRHQQEVFRPASQGCRKVILSTNIAETSVTIPGVRYVVDPGLVKARGYSPLVGLDILSVQPTSQAQARQRAGRAGREAPGACYRLYTENTFSKLRENTEPEILRCPLTSVVLELLAMGVADLLTFDFMTPPSEEGLVAALEQLCVLGAVEGGGEGVRLTGLGRKMSHFPLEPSLSRTILLAPGSGCSEEVVSLVALLSVDSVVFSPPALRDKAASAHLRFHSPHGDHITLLAVYQAYTAAHNKRGWCRENFIHQRNMRTALDVRAQLVDLCGRHGVPLVSNSDGVAVRRAVLEGLWGQTAHHTEEGRYLTLATRQEVFIHPSSCLFHLRPHPSSVMYSQLVHTTKCYMRNVSVIESEWLAK